MPPSYRLHVVPWLRAPAQRLLMPTWLAITIGRHIVAWRPLDEAELAHEVAHVEQWSREGPLFIVRYLRASSRAARAGGDRYRDNEYEQEARRAEERVRQRRHGPQGAR
jgi:hypothetical protein